MCYIAYIVVYGKWHSQGLGYLKFDNSPMILPFSRDTNFISNSSEYGISSEKAFSPTVRVDTCQSRWIERRNKDGVFTKLYLSTFSESAHVATVHENVRLIVFQLGQSLLPASGKKIPQHWNLIDIHLITSARLYGFINGKRAAGYSKFPFTSLVAVL